MSLRSPLSIWDGNSAGIPAGMIETNFHRRPIRAKREMLRPLDNHDGIFGQRVFQAEGFQVWKTFDAVEIDMIQLAEVQTLFGASRNGNAKFVNQIERGAGNVFFLGGTQAADDSFGERGLAAAEVSLQQHQDGRAE